MKRRKNTPLMIILILLSILLPVLTAPAEAAEGAWSSYTPGTYGDFSLNYAPPGLYVRNYVAKISAEVDDYPVQPAVEAKLDQSTWFDLLVITYISEKKLLGGNYFCVFNIPYGFSAKLDADVELVNQPYLSMDDSTSGLGDIQITPIGLMWHKGYFHFVLAENVVLKSGEYNADDLANMGRNYNSSDTLFGMTWLHEKRGHEISFLAGYMINEKNQATDYRTGDEFHIDATIAQYFSESFSVGLVGYHYQQVTDDESPTLTAIDDVNPGLGLPAADGYKSRSTGVGAAIMFSPAKDLQIIGKWITDVDAKNRQEGDLASVSVCYKF